MDPEFDVDEGSSSSEELVLSLVSESQPDQRQRWAEWHHARELTNQRIEALGSRTSPSQSTTQIEVTKLKMELELLHKQCDLLKRDRDEAVAEKTQLRTELARYNPEVINRQQELLDLPESSPEGSSTSSLRNPPATLEPATDPMMRMRQGLCYLGVRRGPNSHLIDGQKRFNQFRDWLRARPALAKARTRPAASTVVFNGTHQLPPFSRTSSRLCKAPPLLLKDLVFWCTPKNLHGLIVCPDYVYGPTETNTQPIWSRSNTWHACGEQEREVFLSKGENIQYLGTYVCHTGPGMLRIHHLGKLGKEATVNSLEQVTHLYGRAPAERKAIRELYNEGTLTLHVLGLERVGFNEPLRESLCSDLAHTFELRRHQKQAKKATKAEKRAKREAQEAAARQAKKTSKAQANQHAPVYTNSDTAAPQREAPPHLGVSQGLPVSGSQGPSLFPAPAGPWPTSAFGSVPPSLSAIHTQVESGLVPIPALPLMPPLFQPAFAGSSHPFPTPIPASHIQQAFSAPLYSPTAPFTPSTFSTGSARTFLPAPLPPSALSFNTPAQPLHVPLPPSAYRNAHAGPSRRPYAPLPPSAYAGSSRPARVPLPPSAYENATTGPSRRPRAPSELEYADKYTGGVKRGRDEDEVYAQSTHGRSHKVPKLEEEEEEEEPYGWEAGGGDEDRVSLGGSDDGGYDEASKYEEPNIGWKREPED